MNNSSGAWGCLGEEAETASLPTRKPTSLRWVQPGNHPLLTGCRGEGGQLCRLSWESKAGEIPVRREEGPGPGDGFLTAGGTVLEGPALLVEEKSLGWGGGPRGGKAAGQRGLGAESWDGHVWGPQATLWKAQAESGSLRLLTPPDLGSWSGQTWRRALPVSLTASARMVLTYKWGTKVLASCLPEPVPPGARQARPEERWGWAEVSRQRCRPGAAWRKPPGLLSCVHREQGPRPGSAPRPPRLLCPPLDSPGGSGRWVPEPPLLWVPGTVLLSLCWRRRPRPPCLPPAIPRSLLRARECVINICSAPHLERLWARTAVWLRRGPFLWGSEGLGWAGGFPRDQPASPTRAGATNSWSACALTHGSGVLAQAAVNPPPPVWGGSCLGPWASQAGLAGPESAGQGSS